MKLLTEKLSITRCKLKRVALRWEDGDDAFNKTTTKSTALMEGSDVGMAANIPRESHRNKGFFADDCKSYARMLPANECYFTIPFLLSLHAHTLHSPDPLLYAIHRLSSSFLIIQSKSIWGIAIYRSFLQFVRGIILSGRSSD